jgi:hypothetical protein
MDPAAEGAATHAMPPDVLKAKATLVEHSPTYGSTGTVPLLISPPNVTKGLANDFPTNTSNAGETISPASVPPTPNSVSNELAPARGYVTASNQPAQGPQSTRSAYMCSNARNSC